MSNAVKIKTNRTVEREINMSQILRYLKQKHWQENGRGGLISPDDRVCLYIAHSEQMLVNSLAVYENRDSDSIVFDVLRLSDPRLTPHDFFNYSPEIDGCGMGGK